MTNLELIKWLQGQPADFTVHLCKSTAEIDGGTDESPVMEVFSVNADKKTYVADFETDDQT